MSDSIPTWLTVGARVTLPDLDRGTSRDGHRYRVVHVKPSGTMRSGVAVGLQAVDAPETKRPTVVDMDHCVRAAGPVDDVAPEYQLPRILA
jgi:hypothetical protein